MPLLADITGNEVVNLDQVDRDILAMLQQDGRASASHIAQEIGMSIPAITERIKKLQDAGIVIGYAANINYNKVGLDVSAFITIISESSDHYSEVIKAANLMPEILQSEVTVDRIYKMAKVIINSPEKMTQMKLDLIRKGDGMHWECNRSHWESLIESAEKSGYKAQGTTQYDFDTGEPDDDWDGTDYSSKSGQLVSSEDAKNLAESLDELITKHQISGAEEEIIVSFLEWVRISITNGEEVTHHYPGFDIW